MSPHTTAHSHTSFVWAAVLALAAAVMGVHAASPRTAVTAPLYGYDVSWPQCSVEDGGYGLPMPPTTAQFVVIGLTKGLPFTENPCLVDQVAWAGGNGVKAQAYTMAAYPTAAQLSTYGAAGPWSTRTTAGRLSNVGYAEGGFALASLSRVGFAPGVVWIDVEPRSAQPWPTASAAQQRNNRYVVEGLMRRLRDAGKAYGLYSYLSGWQTITGSWRLPGVPVWATAGRLDYPAEALDACTRPSFSGGRVYLAQWYDDVRDYDLTCDPYTFTTFAVPPSSLSNSTAEFDGDWNNDVLARVSATGQLRLYGGTGLGTLRAAVTIGSGWLGYNALETPGDLSGDGAQDVLARETSTGYLWLYPGNGRGGWLPRVRVGTNWNVMNALIGVGDFTGDQKNDLLARERSTGYLWLYPGTGTSGWAPRVRVGSGWNAMNAFAVPGDFSGDGAVDLIAREAATGYLWLYPGTGTGGWRARVRIGTGWSTYTIMSPGDLNGDRTSDLVARDSTGRLWLYGGNGTGGWLPRVQIGTGWLGLNPLF
ncbi:MAG TPA: FG-GAP-like repeat-containing protein [Angustibacter sp.]|nr:FG-GAP-like repeat-containing protein [Angustibacter sp.]